MLEKLDEIAVHGAMNRTTVGKQIIVRYLTGKIIDVDQPASAVGKFGGVPAISAPAISAAANAAANAESLATTKLQNQLQNAISRHNREAESLQGEIAKLNREKQQMATRMNEFSAAGLGGVDEADISGHGLAGAIDAKVAERMERYENERKIEDLSRQVTEKTALVAKLEKEVAALELENWELEDALEDAREKSDSEAEIEKKLERYTAPLLSGVARAFPALKGQIESFVNNGLGELPGTAEGMSQEDRDGLEFARDLRRKFSGEEQDMIVELMEHFHANKQLLKHNLHVTQGIAKQQAESSDGSDG